MRSPTDLGTAIRTLRERRRMTIATLARRTKISATRISDLEHGRVNESGSLFLIFRLLESLGAELHVHAHASAPQSDPGFDDTLPMHLTRDDVRRGLEVGAEERQAAERMLKRAPRR